MKNNRGITLIALIVMIIVIVILAAVSINFLFGKESLINKAQMTSNSYSSSAVKERIEMELANLYLENIDGTLTFEMIANRLIEKGITEEGLIDNDSRQIITIEGFIAEITKQGSKWIVNMSEEIATTGIIVNNKLYPNETITTPVAKIKLTAIQMKNGIRKIILPDGTKKTYEGNKKIVHEEYETYKNGTYTFIIEDNDGNTKEQNVEVKNVSIGAIAIVTETDLSTWTNEDIEIEVLWPEDTENLTKEISIDGGNTYKEYTGKVSISKNTTVQARLLHNGTVVKEAENLVINNIDKIKPTKPTITDSKSAKEVTVTVKSSDEESGISKYQVYYNGQWHNRNEKSNTLIDIWTEEIDENVKYRVIDEAGNISDEETILIQIKFVKELEKEGYDQTGEIQSVTLEPGTYKLEVWGAQGGTADAEGGKGGYSCGTYTVTEPTTIYIVVGGQGTSGRGKELAGGYNGGGSCVKITGAYAGTTGGGATHIGLIESTLDGYASNYSTKLLLVAGGGGGSGTARYKENNTGGNGGGLEGEAGKGKYSPGKGGTQQSGGESFNRNGVNTNSGAKFGLGSSVTSTNTNEGSGGGGGFYGGGSGGTSASAGGGSGYTNNTLLKNTNTIAGSQKMPSIDGGEEIGHTGNGFAKITIIE